MSAFADSCDPKATNSKGRNPPFAFELQMSAHRHWRSRQDFNIATQHPLQNDTQFRRIQNLDRPAPRNQVPSHLHPSACTELNQQAAIRQVGHHLIWMEPEVARHGRSAGRKAPADGAVLGLREERAKRLCAVGVDALSLSINELKQQARETNALLRELAQRP